MAFVLKKLKKFDEAADIQRRRVLANLEEFGEESQEVIDARDDLAVTLTIDAVHPAVAFPNLDAENTQTTMFYRSLAKTALQAVGLSFDSQTHRQDAERFLKSSFPRLRFGSSNVFFTYDSESNQFFIPSYYLHGISSEQEFREFVAENYLIGDVLDRETPQA